MVDESMYQVPGQESASSRYAAAGGGHRDERPIPTNNRQKGGNPKMNPSSRGSQKQQRSNIPPGYGGDGHDFNDPVANLNSIVDRFGGGQNK